MKLGPQHSAALARALFRSAVRRNAVELVSVHLTETIRLWNSVPEFRSFGEQRGLSRTRRETILRAVIGGWAHPLVTEFLVRADQWGGLPQIESIARSYEAARRRYTGERSVEIRSAKALDELARRKWSARIQQLIPRAQVTFATHPDLMAGFAFREGDRILDFSAAARLRQLRAAWQSA